MQYRLKHLASIALWCLSAEIAAAAATVGSVTNGADFSSTVAPGSLATVFGSGFTTVAAGSSPSALPFPTTFGGVTVNVNGRPAPITFLGPTQVNIQIPSATAVGPATLSVTVAGQASNTIRFTVVAAAPGIFGYGSNRAVAQNQDYSLNGPDNPAVGGSVIIAYLTGLGATTPAVVDGAASPSTAPLATPRAAAAASIGGLTAPILFIGLTPGNVGLAQANIQIPNLTSGDYPLTITLNGQTSKGSLVAVRAAPPSTGLGGRPEGLPSGATCVSGPVVNISRSLQQQASRLADEVTIGGTKLCPTCDLKPPLYGDFAEKLEAARLDDLNVDVCYDGFKTLNYVRLRQ